MPGQRPILAMSFVASLGITFEALACTVPKGDSNFWPLLIWLIYLMLPMPMIISRRIMKDVTLGTTNGAGKNRDYVLFFISGIMISSVFLPIILTRSPIEKPIISPISCVFVEIGNLLCLATIGLFYIYFKPTDGI